MFILSIHESESRSFRRSGLQPALAGVLFGVLALARSSLADNFEGAHYDPRKDQLVVEIIYRGTNPDHEFSLQWGPCKASADGRSLEIVAEILDSQWQDPAAQDFKKIRRFNLAGLTCRPAVLTLKTPPRFYVTVRIPARPSQ